MDGIDIKKYDEEFTRPIIKYGRLTNLLAIPLCFLPSLAVWFIFGVVPPVKDILTGWGLIASIYAVYAIVEPISYFPMVGLAGTYMICLSGNISNVRIPCAVVTQQTLGVTPGTKKAELVSTIGIAGSIVTNIIVVTIAAVGGALLMSLFPPVVLEAFEYVSPAIYGAMYGMMAMKNKKYGIFAILFVFALLFLKLPAYVIIPLAVFSTIVLGLTTDNKEK